MHSYDPTVAFVLTTAYIRADQRVVEKVDPTRVHIKSIDLHIKLRRQHCLRLSVLAEELFAFHFDLNQTVIDETQLSVNAPRRAICPEL